MGRGTADARHELSCLWMESLNVWWLSLVCAYVFSQTLRCWLVDSFGTLMRVPDGGLFTHISHGWGSISMPLDPK
ncbi:hypothetical protein BDP55DRAFT_310741 [Colletotrichum godetiae]|uniref:Uncharacterized protein n=1 Tax=Colletotrichum godetiae TaxID=1209918 RepID=A0AAJ0AZ83_9PEZI|nr:uncharacterized protein BDP55DRAFT_310741 [Colletotrichum godetiae]KAK1690844.1 hypothetical protein BDP55DRAFT_310741 [Colletotrichum godetiae]